LQFCRKGTCPHVIGPIRKKVRYSELNAPASLNVMCHAEYFDHRQSSRTNIDKTFSPNSTAVEMDNVIK